MDKNNNKNDSKTPIGESKKDALTELMDRLEVQAETISKIHEDVYKYPEKIDSWLELALSDISQGEHSNALVALEQALEIDPNNIDALLLVAKICLRLDAMIHWSVTDLKKIGFSKKTAEKLTNFKAIEGCSMNSNALALACYEKVLQIQPSQLTAEKGKFLALKELDPSFENFSLNKSDLKVKKKRERRKIRKSSFNVSDLVFRGQINY